MLMTIVCWSYIFVVTLIVGYGLNRILSYIIPVPDDSNRHFGVLGYVVTGIVALTVYAETFSIFYKVAAVCHLTMLLATIGIGIKYHKELKALLSGLLFSFKDSSFNRKVIITAIIVAAAFFTSRGTFHTDTGIYHAQAIRLLEEYGIVKGLGNLQLHYAYNSAYLPLCALFTFGFILPLELHLHAMTGFFMVLFTLYAADGLWHFKEHARHGGDFARIGLILYSVTNLTGLQSPATDYGTMFFVLYIFTAWIGYSWEKEKKTGKQITETISLSEGDGAASDISFYGYLSVLAAFAVSMKLSAAFVVLLALLPLFLLIKKKMWKEILYFLILGFCTVLPYLVRNVIISGWLIYPVASVDLFDVIWKIPVEALKHDSDQIKVWGRCLFDVSRVDEGFSSWIPIWFSQKEHYEKMLLYSQVIGLVLLGLNTLRIVRRRILDKAVVLFYVTILVNLVIWFVTAPFIRYGLAYLLLLPLCAVGDALDEILQKKNLILIGLASLITINFFSWIDNYFMDSCVFVKHYAAGYYITPVPFEYGQTTAIDMDGVTVYVAGFDEVNSYYFYPGTCYDDMALSSELIGDVFEEGLKAK